MATNLPPDQSLIAPEARLDFLRSVNANVTAVVDEARMDLTALGNEADELIQAGEKLGNAAEIMEQYFERGAEHLKEIASNTTKLAGVIAQTQEAVEDLIDKSEKRLEAYGELLTSIHENTINDLVKEIREFREAVDQLRQTISEAAGLWVAAPAPNPGPPMPDTEPEQIHEMSPRVAGRVLQAQRQPRRSNDQPANEPLFGGL